MPTYAKHKNIGAKKDAIFEKYNAMNNELKSVSSKFANDNDMTVKLDFPQIAVIGFTSAGKSSLLTQLTGISFPKGDDITTRVPIELRLTCDDYYSLHCHIEPDVDAYVDFTNAKEIKLSKTDSEEEFNSTIEKAISDLQKIILKKTGTSFSKTKVVVTATSPGVPTLTLIDLPGTTTVKTEMDMIAAIHNEYIEKDNTIIVCVVDVKASINNQSWKNMKSKALERTIGVLTKVDCLGYSEKSCYKLLKNDEGNSDYCPNGWYAIRCRDKMELDMGNISVEDARTIEKHFLAGTFELRKVTEDDTKKNFFEDLKNKSKFFSEQVTTYNIDKNVLGTTNLHDKLTQMLKNRLLSTIGGSLGEKINKKVEEIDGELSQLGKVFTSNEELEDQFDADCENLTNSFSQLISRNPYSNNHIDIYSTVSKKFSVGQIYSEISKKSLKFYDEIRRTSPILDSPKEFSDAKDIRDPLFCGLKLIGSKNRPKKASTFEMKNQRRVFEFTEKELLNSSEDVVVACFSDQVPNSGKDFKWHWEAEDNVIHIRPGEVKKENAVGSVKSEVKMGAAVPVKSEVKRGAAVPVKVKSRSISFRGSILSDIEDGFLSGRNQGSDFPDNGISNHHQRNVIRKWKEIANKFVQACWVDAMDCFKNKVDDVFSAFPKLQEVTKEKIREAHKECLKKTLVNIDRHWKLEILDTSTLNYDLLDEKLSYFNSESDVDRLVGNILGNLSVSSKRFSEYVVRELKVGMNYDFHDDFVCKQLKGKLKSEGKKKLYEEPTEKKKQRLRLDAEKSKCEALLQVIEKYNEDGNE